MIDKQNLIDYIRYLSENKNLLDLKVIDNIKNFIEQSPHDDYYSKRILARLERDRNEQLKYYNHDEAFIEHIAERLIDVCSTNENLNTWVLNTLKNGKYSFSSGDTIGQKYLVDLIIQKCFSTTYWLKVVDKEEKFLLNRTDEKHNERRKVLQAIELLKQYSDNENLHYELDKLASQELGTRLTKKIVYKSTFFVLAKTANEELGLPLTTKAKDLANDMLEYLLDHHTKYKPSRTIEYLPYKNVGFYYYK